MVDELKNSREREDGCNHEIFGWSWQVGPCIEVTKKDTWVDSKALSRFPPPPHRRSTYDHILESIECQVVKA